MQSQHSKLLLVFLAVIIIGYLIYTYNKKSTESFEDLNSCQPQNNYLEEQPPADMSMNYSNGNVYGEQEEQMPIQNQNVTSYSNPNIATVTQTAGSCNGPQASEPLGDNEVFTSVANFNVNQSGPSGLNNNQLPKDCFPKDQLSPSELLPSDTNTTWSQVNPLGQGDLQGQSFLNAGFHVGANTVGQTLRNANLQLRSEPPNPQVKVSPWLQSTIEADTNRKPLEIGGC